MLARHLQLIQCSRVAQGRHLESCELPLSQRIHSPPELLEFGSVALELQPGQRAQKIITIVDTQPCDNSRLPVCWPAGVAAVPESRSWR